MNNIVNWFTRKNRIVLAVSSLILTLSIYYANDSFRFLSTTEKIVEYSFFFFSYLAVFSVLSLFINEERLNSWIKFSLWWSVFIIFMLILLPDKCDMFPLCGQTVKIANFVGYPILGLFYLIINKFFSHTKYFKYLLALLILIVAIALSIFISIIV